MHRVFNNWISESEFVCLERGLSYTGRVKSWHVRVQLVASLASLPCAMACDSGGGSGSFTPPPTTIVVSPENFATNLACLDAPGAMRAYVATLFDVTSDFEGEAPALPSSPLTSCDRSIDFGYVEPGRRYRAEIDAYDRTDLTPLSEGNRLLRESQGAGELVAPRWRAACGNGSRVDGGAGADAGHALDFLQGPAEAFLNTAVPVLGCTAFVETTPGVALGTSIQIELAEALGSLQCGNEPGQVFDYEVTLRGDTAAPRRADCSQSVSFPNLSADQGYFFDVAAFEFRAQVGDAGADASTSGDAGTPATRTATWKTSCFQRAVRDVAQTAVCDPLRETP